VKARILGAAVLAALTICLLAIAPAWAVSAHFTSTPTISRTGDSLTVGFKVAGLGNNQAIDYAVTADASCVNRGGNTPQAENKGAVLASGTLTSDKNGNVVASVSGSAQTDPVCNPPMVLRYDRVTLTVGGLTYTFLGTF
jgi:hypothetical protein